MGFDFKVVYKKGAEYSAAENIVLNALPILVPNWLEPIKEATLNDPQLQEIKQGSCLHIGLKADRLIYFKNRIYLPLNIQIFLTLLLQSFTTAHTRVIIKH